MFSCYGALLPLILLLLMSSSALLPVMACASVKSADEDTAEVDAEMEAFHERAWDVCGVVFKAIKDRLAASRFEIAPCCEVWAK